MPSPGVNCAVLRVLRPRPVNRLLTAALLLWLVLMSSLAIVHNAEHGFHRHAHMGQECPVYDFCEHQNLGTLPPVLPLLAMLVLPVLVVIPRLTSFINATPLAVAPARGPPSRA